MSGENKEERKRNDGTIVWNKQESRRKHWATRSSICSFAHSLAPHCLLRSGALLRSFAHSLPYSWEYE